MAFDVSRLCDLYDPDPERIALARRRQAAVWCGERPDRWPIQFMAPLTEAQDAIPKPDFKEAFYDADQMLCSQVRAACAAANSRSDGVPSARGNYGTGTMLSCLGLEQEIYPDKMPWLKRHLSRREVAALGPDDIRVRGAFERGLAYMRRHLEVMGTRLPLYCMDTQGPLDLAHLLLGDDLFYLFYDDPPLVRHALDLCVELGVKTHLWMKEVCGEAPDEMHHSNGLYAANVGIRICEDSTVLLGPQIIEEFAVPHTQRLAHRFGAAWVHYCGRNDRLTEAMCRIPEVRGLNFGHRAGHEHEHVFDEDMRRCAEWKKIYFGGWPRLEGETGPQYLERMHRWAVQGCFIPQADPALREPDGFPSVEAALDYWYGLG